jgi:hypothetical protein
MPAAASVFLTGHESELQIAPKLVHQGMEKKPSPTLSARFFRTVQFGWPLGMPLVAHLESGIWEVRIRLSTRIARVLFVLEGDTMVLLNGFIKKEQKTPKPELDLAKERLKLLKRQK